MNDEEIERWASELVRAETLTDIDALPPHTEAVFVARLDDEKIKALTRLNRLRRLVQDGGSCVTDDGLEVLGSMLTLEEVDLEWSGDITDTGLAHLHKLVNLKWLDVRFCAQLTQDGIAKLATALLDCEIVR